VPGSEFSHATLLTTGGVHTAARAEAGAKSNAVKATATVKIKVRRRGADSVILVTNVWGAPELVDEKRTSPGNDGARFR
jgi:hypothetical protein